jgi:flagellar hook-basal body complex protein FliE
MANLSLALKAMNENLQSHATPQNSPALYNISIALREIVAALQESQQDLQKIRRATGA